MKASEAQKKIDALRSEITEHDRRYHVLAAPIISDRDYDRLVEELRDLESKFPEFITPESPTQRVGGEPTKLFPPAVHHAPMLSLANTYNTTEVEDFARRITEILGHDPEQGYTCELK